jgi:hypothetical protein
MGTAPVVDRDDSTVGGGHRVRAHPERRLQ